MQQSVIYEDKRIVSLIRHAKYAEAVAYAAVLEERMLPLPSSASSSDLAYVARVVFARCAAHARLQQYPESRLAADHGYEIVTLLGLANCTEAELLYRVLSTSLKTLEYLAAAEAAPRPAQPCLEARCEPDHVTVLSTELEHECIDLAVETVDLLMHEVLSPEFVDHITKTRK